MAAVRGCGTRKQGGVYLCCGTSKWGKPVEHFLKDYPQPLPPALRLSPLGVRLIERDGITHVLDWVGESHYPNVWDYIEEVRRFGSSRHVARTLDFSKLTLNSKHLLVHPRAIVTNWHEFFRHAEPFDKDIWKKEHCPKHIHEEADGPCLGICKNATDPFNSKVGMGRLVTRLMPSFGYTARHAPEGFTPKYQAGIFMALPIQTIEVVMGGNHQDAVSRTRQSEIPTQLMEE